MVPTQNKRETSHIVLLALLVLSLLCIVSSLIMRLSALDEVEKIPVDQLLQQYWQQQLLEPTSDDGATIFASIDSEEVAAQLQEPNETSSADIEGTAMLPIDDATGAVSGNYAAEAAPNDGAAGVTPSSDLVDNPSSSTSKIDINNATTEQLQTLKGIGPSKAAAIVADREQKGKYKRIEDIKRVKGIGEKLFAGIEESIVASP
jgi:comEA protein